MARTFTEAEAQKVFARVAERQRATGAASAGLSLADLEEAAQAAGLDPTLIASAAAELDAPAAGQAVLGAPTEVVRHRLIRGTVSDEVWEDIVAAARAEFGLRGIAGQVGRVREWTVSAGGRRQSAVTTRVSLEPAGADTRLVLSQSVRQAAVGFAIAGAVHALMAVVFSIVALAASEPDLWIAVAMMATMATLFLGGSQAGLRLWERRQQRRSAAFLDRLDLLARDAAPHRAETERLARRVDPALFDTDAPEPEGGDARARTRT